MGSSQVDVPFGPLRLFRLARLTRMARLVRSIPELLVMTQGLIQGARACAATIVLILMMIYIFAIALLAILKDEQKANGIIYDKLGVHFKTLGDCMWILLIDGTFLLDGTGNILTILLFEGDGITSVFGSIIFLAYLLLAAMVICNMLIGILCAVVQDVTQNEKDFAAARGLKVSMLQHLEKYDDGDGLISKMELEEVMHEPESQAILEELRIDRVFLQAVQRMLYATTAQIPIKDAMELMLTCRADSPATVHTLAQCLSYLSWKLNSVEQAVRGESNRGMNSEKPALLSSSSEAMLLRSSTRAE